MILYNKSKNCCLQNIYYFWKYLSRPLDNYKSVSFYNLHTNVVINHYLCKVSNCSPYTILLKAGQKDVLNAVQQQQITALAIARNFSMRSSCLLFSTKLSYWGSPTLQCRHYTNRNILKLHERGLWKERFPDTDMKFEQSLATSTQTVYAGFDPTADSLHIGNLLVLMALLHCQRAGHSPIVLLGGFTSTVGDPSGLSSERPALSDEAAAANLAQIKRTVNRVFGNHSKFFWKHSKEEPLKPLIVLDNNEWLHSMSLSHLLSVLARVKVRNLLACDYIQDRLNNKHTKAALTAKEFMYQVCQAIDWLHLFDKYNCNIQVGGSDQLGNIIVGHDLIRDSRNTSVTGLTVPLLVSSFGEKLGKSAGNALWLSPDKTTYFDFYQYFIRRKDSEVEQLLKLFTFMPLNDIKILMEKHMEAPEKQLAQKKLAETLMLLVHGEHGLHVAQASTRLLYHNDSTALLQLLPHQLLQLFSGHVTHLSLEPGTTVLSAALKAGCFVNDADGETMIRRGALHINQAPVREPHLVLLPDAHILPSGYTLFRVGKKKFTLVAWNQSDRIEASS